MRHKGDEQTSLLHIPAKAEHTGGLATVVLCYYLGQSSSSDCVHGWAVVSLSTREQGWQMCLPALQGSLSAFTDLFPCQDRPGLGSCHCTESSFVSMLSLSHLRVNSLPCFHVPSPLVPASLCPTTRTEKDGTPRGLCAADRLLRWAAKAAALGSCAALGCTCVPRPQLEPSLPFLPHLEHPLLGYQHV